MVHLRLMLRWGAHFGKLYLPYIIIPGYVVSVRFNLRLRQQNVLNTTD